MKFKAVKIAAIVSAFFGLLTVFAGGSVILDLFGMREKEGNYILFVVWANFICGFLYLFVSYGFYKSKNWTTPVLSLTVWILIAAFIVLLVWIKNDEPYETKTIVAMIFRTLLTLILLFISRSFNRRFSINHVL